MPVIKARARRIPMVRHFYRLTAANRDVLVKYAQMIGDSPDYVMNQLIERMLATDRDFQQWRAQQPTEPRSAAAPSTSSNPITSDRR
jgi:hypothetical protein